MKIYKMKYKKNIRNIRNIRNCLNEIRNYKKGIKYYLLIIK